jgi:uncharacterized membrane-anchored protein YhcB (DUF1043 family)
MFTFKYEDGSIKRFTSKELEDIALKKVVDRCKEEISDNNFVRLRNVIKNELQLSYPIEFYKRIAYHFSSSEKYLFNEIKVDNNIDYEIFKAPKKSWKERNWWAATAINISIGLVLGFFFRIITEPKQIQQSNQQESVRLLPNPLDTLHKNQ